MKTHWKPRWRGGTPKVAKSARRPAEASHGQQRDNYDDLNEQAAVQERAVGDLVRRMETPEPLSKEVLRARLDEAERTQSKEE